MAKKAWATTHRVMLTDLVARAIRNAIRANRFGIETPIFIEFQADSHESLEFPIPRDSRESCESIRANHATKLTELHLQ